jgi:hypothetical protein
MVGTLLPEGRGKNMLEFPREMRDLIVESLDEYTKSADGELSASEFAEFVAETFVSTAEECGVDESDGLLNQLAESGELKTPFLEVLTSAFANLELREILSEEILEVVEELCDLDWTDEVSGFSVSFDDDDDDNDDDDAF